MCSAAELLDALDSCPHGATGWQDYENIGVEILSFLFVPPLQSPHIQPRTFSGIDRRDAIFPNRNMDITSIWGQLRQEVAARMLLVEFKNYDHATVGKEEVDQTQFYLTEAIGKLAFICCRVEPSEQARFRCNQAFSRDRKVILFLTDEYLREMLRMKERGSDPSLFIMDLLELFYIQHE